MSTVIVIVQDFSEHGLRGAELIQVLEAALYAQNFQDPAVLATVNEIENRRPPSPAKAGGRS